MKPQLAALATQYKGKVSTWAVNVDRAPNLSPVYAFDGVPALIGFHGGQPVWRQVGAPDPAILAAMFEDLSKRGDVQTWGTVTG